MTLYVHAAGTVAGCTRADLTCINFAGDAGDAPFSISFQRAVPDQEGSVAQISAPVLGRSKVDQPKRLNPNSEAEPAKHANYTKREEVEESATVKYFPSPRARLRVLLSRSLACLADRTSEMS